MTTCLHGEPRACRFPSCRVFIVLIPVVVIGLVLPQLRFAPLWGFFVPPVSLPKPFHTPAYPIALTPYPNAL